MAQASFYCPQCRQMKLFVGENMSHTAHILASVFLCGLWLPIWLLLAATHQPQYRCNNCGFTDRIKYLTNPSLRAKEARDAEARRHYYETKAQNSDGFASFYYRLAAHPNFIQIIIGVIAAVFFGIVILAISSGSSKTPAVSQTSTTPQRSVNTYDEWTSKLKISVSRSFSSAAWYPRLKNIVVKPALIEVETDLEKADKTASMICLAVSNQYYSTPDADHSAALILYGVKGSILVQRRGSKSPCQ